MAGKNNAKPAEQAKPAKDAAMAEATNGAAEQAVTPLVPEGEAGTSAPPAEDDAQPGAGADESQSDGAEEFDTAMWFPGTDRQGSEARFNPDHVREFIKTAFQAFALMLIEADVRVRKNGEEVSPSWEDLPAVTLRQDEVVFVTCDGRKFKLKGEKINEA